MVETKAIESLRTAVQTPFCGLHCCFLQALSYLDYSVLRHNVGDCGSKEYRGVQPHLPGSEFPTMLKVASIAVARTLRLNPAGYDRLHDQGYLALCMAN